MEQDRRSFLQSLGLAAPMAVIGLPQPTEWKHKYKIGDKFRYRNSRASIKGEWGYQITGLLLEKVENRVRLSYRLLATPGGYDVCPAEDGFDDFYEKV